MTQEDMRLKRDGSWVVELNLPLHHAGRQYDEIRIKPLTMGQLVRWNNGQIVSIMGLMAELTDLPEMLLRQITFPDVDRLMLAFAAMMPPVIQAAMTNQSRPMATPDNQLPPEYSVDARISDQVDPRFPHVEGPVRRFPVPPQFSQPGQPQQPALPQDSQSIAQPPDIMKAV